MIALATLDDQVGRVFGPSAWLRFTQREIDAYCALTGETYPIHTQPGSRDAEPFGGTIVPGSLVMARLPAWQEEVGLMPPPPATGLNYGFDKVRIPSPLLVGQGVRATLTLVGVERRRAGLTLLAIDAVVEGEGGEKPILSARWLVGILG